MKIPFFEFNLKVISYVTRIVFGAVIVWWSLSYLHDSKKVWALISVIIVSDPDFATVRTTIVSRAINTITGCLVGLLFMYVLGVNLGAFFGAIIASVILSTSFKNYPTSWKLAPATVVIVMAPSIVDNTRWQEAMIVALTRTGEVLYGCLVAFVLGLLFMFVKKNWQAVRGVKEE